ncbi:MAG: DUF58 domain-containing protein [Pseudomonadota bacterium]
MRPSARLLWIALGAFALSAVLMAAGEGTRAVAPFVWLPVLMALAGDLAISVARPVAVEIAAPDEMFTGQTIALVVTPSRRPRGLTAQFDWPEGLDGPESAPLDGAAATPVEITARRRGTWPVTRLWLSWPSALGLVELVPRLTLDLTITAVPDIRPVQSGVIDVKVRSTLFGVKENFARGEGSEFHQLRDFVQGMDTRAIDWKRSARHQGLVAKEMRAERNHHVIVALDNGYLMRSEAGGLPKIDHAVNAALVTAWAAGVGGDMVGLFAYDARPRLFVPPEPGRRAFARLRSRTAELAYESVETNHTLGMASLIARTPRRSLIIVFSDFVDVTGAELMVENMAALARRHVVVFVAIRDPAVEAIAATAPGDVDGISNAVAAGGLISERRLVMERLGRLGVLVIDAAPGQVSARVVSTYLDLKAREAA